MDVTARGVPEAAREYFYPQKCERCARMYVPGMTIGGWLCAMHVGERMGGTWTCCGASVAWERRTPRGCVPTDHSTVLHASPPVDLVEVPSELYNFLEYHFNRNGSRVEGEGDFMECGDYMYVAPTDMAAYAARFAHARTKAAEVRYEFKPDVAFEPVPHGRRGREHERVSGTKRLARYEFNTGIMPAPPLKVQLKELVTVTHGGLMVTNNTRHSDVNASMGMCSVVIPNHGILNIPCTHMVGVNTGPKIDNILILPRNMPLDAHDMSHMWYREEMVAGVRVAYVDHGEPPPGVLTRILGKDRADGVLVKANKMRWEYGMCSNHVDRIRWKLNKYVHGRSMYQCQEFLQWKCIVVNEDQLRGAKAVDEWGMWLDTDAVLDDMLTDTTITNAEKQAIVNETMAYLATHRAWVLCSKAWSNVRGMATGRATHVAVNTRVPLLPDRAWEPSDTAFVPDHAALGEEIPSEGNPVSMVTHMLNNYKKLCNPLNTPPGDGDAGTEMVHEDTSFSVILERGGKHVYDGRHFTTLFWGDYRVDSRREATILSCMSWNDETVVIGNTSTWWNDHYTVGFQKRHADGDKKLIINSTIPLEAALPQHLLEELNTMKNITGNVNMFTVEILGGDDPVYTNGTDAETILKSAMAKAHGAYEPGGKATRLKNALKQRLEKMEKGEQASGLRIQIESMEKDMEKQREENKVVQEFATQVINKQKQALEESAELDAAVAAGYRRAHEQMEERHERTEEEKKQLKMEVKTLKSQLATAQQAPDVLDESVKFVIKAAIWESVKSKFWSMFTRSPTPPAPQQTCPPQPPPRPLVPQPPPFTGGEWRDGVHPMDDFADFGDVGVTQSPLVANINMQCADGSDTVVTLRSNGTCAVRDGGGIHVDVRNTMGTGVPTVHAGVPTVRMYDKTVHADASHIRETIIIHGVNFELDSDVPTVTKWSDVLAQRDMTVGYAVVPAAPDKLLEGYSVCDAKSCNILFNQLLDIFRHASNVGSKELVTYGMKERQQKRTSAALAIQGVLAAANAGATAYKPTVDVATSTRTLVPECKDVVLVVHDVPIIQRGDAVGPVLVQRTLDGTCTVRVMPATGDSDVRFTPTHVMSVPYPNNIEQPVHTVLQLPLTRAAGLVYMKKRMDFTPCVGMECMSMSSIVSSTALTVFGAATMETQLKNTFDAYNALRDGVIDNKEVLTFDVVSAEIKNVLDNIDAVWKLGENKAAKYLLERNMDALNTMEANMESLQVMVNKQESANLRQLDAGNVDVASSALEIIANDAARELTEKERECARARTMVDEGQQSGDIDLQNQGNKWKYMACMDHKFMVYKFGKTPNKSLTHVFKLSARDALYEQTFTVKYVYDNTQYKFVNGIFIHVGADESTAVAEVKRRNAVAVAEKTNPAFENVVEATKLIGAIVDDMGGVKQLSRKLQNIVEIFTAKHETAKFLTAANRAVTLALPPGVDVTTETAVMNEPMPTHTYMIKPTDLYLASTLEYISTAGKLRFESNLIPYVSLGEWEHLQSHFGANYYKRKDTRPHTNILVSLFSSMSTYHGILNDDKNGGFLYLNHKNPLNETYHTVENTGGTLVYTAVDETFELWYVYEIVNLERHPRIFSLISPRNEMEYESNYYGGAAFSPKIHKRKQLFLEWAEKVYDYIQEHTDSKHIRSQEKQFSGAESIFFPLMKGVNIRRPRVNASESNTKQIYVFVVPILHVGTSDHVKGWYECAQEHGRYDNLAHIKIEEKHIKMLNPFESMKEFNKEHKSRPIALTAFRENVNVYIHNTLKYKETDYGRTVHFSHVEELRGGSTEMPMRFQFVAGKTQTNDVDMPPKDIPQWDMYRDMVSAAQVSGGSSVLKVLNSDAVHVTYVHDVVSDMCNITCTGDEEDRVEGVFDSLFGTKPSPKRTRRVHAFVRSEYNVVDTNVML